MKFEKQREHENHKLYQLRFCACNIQNRMDSIRSILLADRALRDIR